MFTDAMVPILELRFGVDLANFSRAVFWSNSVCVVGQYISLDGVWLSELDRSSAEDVGQ